MLSQLLNSCLLHEWDMQDPKPYTRLQDLT
jgi:hypothetical protein